MKFSIVDIRTGKTKFSSNVEWIVNDMFKYWKSPWGEYRIVKEN